MLSASSSSPSTEGAGLAAVDLDDRLPRVARLAGAVDRHRVGDLRQGRRGLDDVRGRPREREVDRIRGRVGIDLLDDRSERAGAPSSARLVTV